MPIDRLYTGEDLGPGWNERDKLGFPGEYPFTRGIHPTMYRGRLWTMRQFAGFGTAEQTNERFRRSRRIPRSTRFFHRPKPGGIAIRGANPSKIVKP